jgi:DNA-binding NarL/FixJ family response regulator
VVQVWVVASSTALRAGLHLMLQTDERLEVSGEARSLAELEEVAPLPDVLLLAGEMPPLAELRQVVDFTREPPALLWMTDDLPANLELTRLPWRAWGVISLDSASSELAAAVQALHAGLLVGTPPLLRKALSPHSLEERPVETLDDPLTARELEVLQSLAQGLANKQIAQALIISEHTVKFHVSAIYAKLGVTNRTEAVRAGIQRGLVIV